MACRMPRSNFAVMTAPISTNNTSIVTAICQISLAYFSDAIANATNATSSKSSRDENRGIFGLRQLDHLRQGGYAAGMISQRELVVSTLGERRFRSPLPMSTVPGDGVGDFVPDDTRVLYDICFPAGQPPSDLAFERAGARENLFFDP